MGERIGETALVPALPSRQIHSIEEEGTEESRIDGLINTFGSILQEHGDLMEAMLLARIRGVSD